MKKPWWEMKNSSDHKFWSCYLCSLWPDTCHPCSTPLREPLLNVLLVLEPVVVRSKLPVVSTMIVTRWWCNKHSAVSIFSINQETGFYTTHKIVSLSQQSQHLRHLVTRRYKLTGSSFSTFHIRTFMSKEAVANKLDARGWYLMQSIFE